MMLSRAVLVVVLTLEVLLHTLQTGYYTAMHNPSVMSRYDNLSIHQLVQTLIQTLHFFYNRAANRARKREGNIDEVKTNIG